MKNRFDFEDAFEKKLIDYNNDISSRSIKISSKIKFENKLKINEVSKVLREIPKIGESIHIVSSGKFDYFSIIPH